VDLVEVLDGVEIMEQQAALEDILVVVVEMDGIIILGVLEVEEVLIIPEQTRLILQVLQDLLQWHMEVY
jgi:hypothetical protein